jgi:hypothetical protein
MTTMNRDAGRMAATRSYAEKLVTVAPNDPAVANLLREIKR